MSYITVKNSDGEKVLPIQYLLKDPIQNLFAELVTISKTIGLQEIPASYYLLQI